MLGLFINQQLGVFGFFLVAVKLKISKLSQVIDLDLEDFYRVNVLKGIGFTMTFFIDSLAFVDAFCLIMLINLLFCLDFYSQL